MTDHYKSYASIDEIMNGHFIAACDPDTIRSLLDERVALVAENARLREALRAILYEVSEGHVPYSSDSYLPPHLVEQARAALGMEGLSNDRARRSC